MYSRAFMPCILPPWRSVVLPDSHSCSPASRETVLEEDLHMPQNY